MGHHHSSSQSYTVGYKYYMSLLMGLAQGPIDMVRRITIGDQDVWTGELDDLSKLKIDKPSLFGGNDGEGGVSGTLQSFFGSASQIIPASIKKIIGDTDIPEFRGVATLWFDGMVCAMNPYPKTWKFRLVRRQNGWDGEVWQAALCNIDMTATVSVEKVDSNGEGTGEYEDVTDTINGMNPAHILYQLLTDRVFGRGYPRSWIDEIGFLAAATQLSAEQFGLCTTWDTANQSLADFIASIVNAIGAALYIDRQSGLITLKLIRDDYDTNMLPSFSRGNGLIDISADTTDASGAEINEQVVTYTDPISNQTRQVRAQNLASMESLGYKNTTTTTYSCIPTASLAGRVALRDLKAQGSNLRKYTVTLDRRAWKVAPGSVFKIHVPERGIDNMVLRAGDIRDSAIEDGSITVSATTDVFGLPSQAYTSDVSSTWTPPPSGPQTVKNYAAPEASYRDIVQGLGDADQAAALSRVLGTPVVYAESPVGTAAGYSVQSSPDGVTWDDVSSMSNFTTTGTLNVTMSPWTDQITLTDIVDTDHIAAGQAIMIDNEVMRVDEIDDDVFKISRGCVDTIPAVHSMGATVWFIDSGNLIDGTEYSRGETVKSRIITNMLNGSLDPTLAPVASTTITGRQGQPWPPANVQLNSGNFDANPLVSDDLTITWVGRNRLIAQDVLISFSEAGQNLEANTVTRLQVLYGTTVLYDLSFSDSNGAWKWSKQQQIEDFALVGRPASGIFPITVKMWSEATLELDGAHITLPSWQSYTMPLRITAAPTGLRVTQENAFRVTSYGVLRRIEVGVAPGAKTFTIGETHGNPVIGPIVVAAANGPQAFTLDTYFSGAQVSNVTVRIQHALKFATVNGNPVVNPVAIGAKAILGGTLFDASVELLSPTLKANPVIGGNLLDSTVSVMPATIPVMFRVDEDDNVRITEEGDTRTGETQE